jgi:peroxiredoxin (alkyl hydroperoxide reductase subunit C)
MNRSLFQILLFFSVLMQGPNAAMAQDLFVDMGRLKPVDSTGALKVHDTAPDFTLPAVNGSMIRLSDFKGRKNVMLTFVPAAWTSVCSDQWPGYNLLEDMFAEHQTTVLGITVDNLPTLSAWTQAMGGLWFPVLSDFWPHGSTAETYGILRKDGMSERAVFVIDRQGVIRYADIHDVNKRPPLEPIMRAVQELGSQPAEQDSPHSP